MRRRAPPSLTLVIVFGAGCTAPGIGNLSAGDDEPTTSPGTTIPGGTALDPVPTTDAGAQPASTSTPPGSTSVGGGTTGEVSGTTAGDPLAPPVIVGHELGPDPLEHAGPIAISIDTAHATGVRMQVDDGAPVDLLLAQPDAFHGQIAFYSALDNGADHTATFVAWRDALESEALVLPFTVALPTGGSELYWEGDLTLGKGVVVALAVTPADEVIELGTYYPKGQARCYLRRRDLGGAWGPGDTVDLMPATHCTAIDLAVDGEGALHVLASREVDGELRWWLGKIDAWGAAPTNLGAGAPGEVASALALDPTRAAVCGTTPGQPFVDAAAWIFSPNKPGNVLSFDHASDLDLPIHFGETPRDCIFADGLLVLVGAARGVHDEDNVVRDRHFVLEVDVAANQRQWTVSTSGPGSQSKAQAIAVDAEGRYITAGSTCEDACQPRGELRMFLPGGVQIWQKALAPAVLSPQAVAWSPADYLVYVGARTEAQDTTAFFAEAWFALHGVPLWSYDHFDGPTIHAANAVTIGSYGQIYAGGVTAGGYPAVAFIAP